MSNAIVIENANSGSSGWQVGTIAGIEIQAYGDQCSLDPGSTINFYVSTQNAADGYSLAIYRLGWYAGMGGRLVYSASGLSGTAQGYWNQGGSAFVGMAPSIDATTHLFEAGWTITDSWAVPANACTGAYVAKFTHTSSHKETNVAFVVRGNAGADYLYIRPDTTDAAYNDWGGWSLYTTTRAYKVSLNRPQRNYANTGGVYGYEINLIQWLENVGYNIAYRSDIDVHVNNTILQNYKAVLYMPHDEYWSKEMYDGAIAALAGKVGLAFLGADACYWNIRFEPSAASVANRTITCYKVSTLGGTLSTDPYYGVDNTRVGALWRDAVLNRPENALMGIMFYDYSTIPQNVGWTTDASMDTSYMAGTGLIAGTTYGTDMVGYEWDNNVVAGGPSNLKIIGTSTQTTGINFGTSTSKTTTYLAPSGALVFAAGSMAWTWGLGSYRFPNGNNGSGLHQPIPQIQLLMQNIMAGIASAKASTSFSSFNL